MKYVNMLSKISDLIKKSRNRNWIIIGDNSSGKSELLKKIVSECSESIYYIDAVNRYFNITEVNISDTSVNFGITSNEIVEKRISPECYNLKDSFGENEHIERLYPIYELKLKKLVKEFLNIELSVEREELPSVFGKGDAKVKVNGEQIELSNGYQALIRLFSEIIFYTEELKENGIIVIDEVDEFLSQKYSGKILNFLVEKFPNDNFIVSTHSSDLIANSCDCNIVALESSSFSVVDSNDFTSLTEVNMLFNKVLGYTEQPKQSDIENTLQRLFDLKITSNWKEEEEIEFNRIEFEKLTPTQKVIYKQIKEW